MYGLKAVVTLLTIFTISTNLSSLQSNLFVKNEETVFSKYGDCSYFTLRDLSGQGDEKFLKAWDGIYKSDYNKIKPIICVNILDEKSDHILVNKNAKDMLQGLKKYLDKKAEDSDIVVFIPKRMDGSNARAEVSESIEKFVEVKEASLDIQYVTYDKWETLAYMSDTAACGIKNTVNPTAIYLNNEEIQVNADLVFFAGNEIMYKITDNALKEVDEKYELSSHEFEIVQTNVKEAYQYKKSFVTKLISFLSSICVVASIFQIILILVINALEYRLNALELSIKKILGYRLWDKNKKIIIFSVGMDLIAVFVLSIAGIFIDAISIPLCILTGLVVAAVELFVVIWNILRMEKESVHKALKGGCL